MDPFLEGSIWPDVHHNLAAAIQELLAQKIAPKYVARVETYTVEDTEPQSEVGITYPDIAILHRRELQEPTAAYQENMAVTAPDLVITTSITVRIPAIHIFDTAKNRLVTCIEILSPVNKRIPGWQTYHDKRKDLHLAGVHLLEIDLLRRGKRHVTNPKIPDSDYLFSLWRAGHNKLEIWTNRLQETLPLLPVPLISPDPDAVLPLKTALDMIYQRGLYNLSIDYSKSPAPPELSEETIQWIRGLL